MVDFLAVGVGGLIGSCIRFALTKLFNGFAPAFPYGTLLSNVIAGLFIGFLMGLEQHSPVFSPETKLFLTTGVLGGLSTFSTFSLDTVVLFQKGNYLLATGNILLNLSLSLLFVVVGMTAAKLILQKV